MAESQAQKIERLESELAASKKNSGSRLFQNLSYLNRKSLDETWVRKNVNLAEIEATIHAYRVDHQTDEAQLSVDISDPKLTKFKDGGVSFGSRLMIRPKYVHDES